MVKRPTAFERDLHNLHGDLDVEVIEMDAERVPTGRRYATIRPAPKTYPWYVQLGALAALPFMLFYGLCLLIVGAGALGLLWIIANAMFHNTFG